MDEEPPMRTATGQAELPLVEGPAGTEAPADAAPGADDETD